MTDRKLIIFDFDGTLVETHSGFVEALKEFSDTRGLPHCGVKMGAGYTNPHMYDLGWGVALEQQEALLREMQFYYNDQVTHHNRFMPTLFDGAAKVLAQLAEKYDLGIVTSRNRSSLLSVLKYHDLAKYFKGYRSFCCVHERGYKDKPSPEGLYCLVDELKQDIKNCIVIGDTIADIEMAHNAGIPGIAVTYGVHTRDRLAAAKPIMMLENIRDLPQAVEELFE